MAEAERAFRKLSRKSFWRKDHDWIFGRFRLKYFGNSSSKQLDLNTEWSKNLPDTYMWSVQAPSAVSWRQRVKLALVHRWMQVYKVRSAFPRNDMYDLRDRYGEEEWKRMQRQFLWKFFAVALALYYVWQWLLEQWHAMKRQKAAKDNLYIVKQSTYDRVRRASHGQGEGEKRQVAYSLLPYTAAASNASVPTSSTRSTTRHDDEKKTQVPPSSLKQCDM